MRCEGTEGGDGPLPGGQRSQGLLQQQRSLLSSPAGLQDSAAEGERPEDRLPPGDPRSQPGVPGHRPAEHSVLGGVQQQQGPGLLHHPVRSPGPTLELGPAWSSSRAAPAGQTAAQHDRQRLVAAPETRPHLYPLGEEDAVREGGRQEYSLSYRAAALRARPQEDGEVRVR